MAFIDDIKQEPIIRKYIETYCYPHFYNSIIFADDMKDQYNGIDYFLDGEKHDIKAQTKRYICNPTPTFILEIATLNKYNEWKPGWFIKKSETEYYDFVWIHEANYKYSGSNMNENNRFIFSPEDILRLEVMSVSVDKIKSRIIQDFNMTPRDLWDYACNMRERYRNSQAKNIMREQYNGLKFSLSLAVPESPVNIIMSKNWYSQLSPLYYECNRGKIIEYNGLTHY